MNGLDALLSPPGEAPRCRVIAADLAVHWFASASDAPGEPCLCGATVRDAADDDDDEPTGGQACGT